MGWTSSASESAPVRTRSIRYHVSEPRIAPSFLLPHSRLAPVSGMRIRFHKILNEGRSVRYEKRPEDRDVIDLNIIVMKEARPRGRD